MGSILKLILIMANSLISILMLVALVIAGYLIQAGAAQDPVAPTPICLGLLAGVVAIVAGYFAQMGWRML